MRGLGWVLSGLRRRGVKGLVVLLLVGGGTGVLAGEAREQAVPKKIGFREVVVAVGILALATAAAEFGAVFLGKKREQDGVQPQRHPPVEEMDPHVLAARITEAMRQDIHMLMENQNSLGETIAWFIRRILQIPGLHCTAVYVLNEQGALNLVAHQGLSSDFVQERSILPLSPQHHQVRVLDFASMMEERNNHAELLDGIRSTVEAPVIHEDRMIALIKVSSRTESVIEPHTVRLITGMAAFMAPVLAQRDSASKA